jgi:YD repeat-containing protein
MKRITLTVFVVFNILTGFAQGGGEVGTTQELKKSPIAPSPNASAIGKFGEIPVSLSTGIPSVSIPIHAYKGNNNGFGLDVSLRYHAGGHKVDDMASNVGLGWSLNAGGVISRSMRGRPDDYNNGYLHTGNVPNLFTANFDYQFTEASASTSANLGICYGNSSDFVAVKNIAEAELDGECDIFQFSVGNISGKFYFKKNGEIQLVSQSNIKISYSMNSSPLYINEFIITDESGNKYFFNEKEWSSATNSLGSTPPTAPPYISSWYIKKIVAVDSNKEIVFNYTGSESQLIYEGSFSQGFRNTWAPSGGFGGFYVLESAEETQAYSNIELTYQQKISSINLPSGDQVLFEYSLSRADFVGDKALTAIRVVNGSFEKKFVLSYDYFVSPYSVPVPYSVNDYFKRLKLLSVQQISGSQQIPAYTFEYNSTALPTRNSLAKDAWGYYAGTGGTPTPVNILAPSGYYFTLAFGSGLVSEQYTKAWVLEKINYPTGGYTSFEYEINQGKNNGTDVLIGGLRVKKTKDYNQVDGGEMITNYSYLNADQTSSGRMQTMPNSTYYWTTTLFHSEDVFASNYKKYHLNQNRNPTQSLSYFNGSPVIYTRVKVEKTQNGNGNGYVIHEFTGFVSTFVHEDNFPFVQKQDLDWAQGLPVKESTYNNSNQLLRVIENEYQDFTYVPYSDPQSRNLIAGLLFWDNMDTYDQKLYGARFYYMAYGRSRLTKTTETTYENGLSSSIVKNYYYDNSAYFYSNRTVTANSKGQAITLEKKYPQDFVGTTIYDQMIAKNMLNYEIESTSKNNGTLMAGEKVLYKWYNSNTQLLTEGANRYNRISQNYEPVFRMNHYDAAGNVLEQQKVNDLKTSYIWAYNSSYPIAEINNGDYGSVAYSSFESTETGNWDYSSSGITTSYQGITGKKAFALSSSNIQRTGLLSSMSYVVTYWKNDAAGGSVSIGGTALMSKNGWTLYQTTVTGVTTVTISGSAVIDELRLYPQNAQMTTYTYDPLIGMTSQCDINNRISYYEYDEFGRLLRIRDMDKNILKTFEYKYKEVQ